MTGSRCFSSVFVFLFSLRIITSSSFTHAGGQINSSTGENNVMNNAVRSQPGLNTSCVESTEEDAKLYCAAPSCVAYNVTRFSIMLKNVLYSMSVRTEEAQTAFATVGYVSLSLSFFSFPQFFSSCTPSLSLPHKHPFILSSPRDLSFLLPALLAYLPLFSFFLHVLTTT